MLKQTVTFKNIDNNDVTRDLYFNISKTELAEQEALSDGQFSANLKSIASSDKLSEVYPMVIEIIKLGYGVRTPDGDFVKSAQSWELFKGSMAYNKLIEDILLDHPEANGQLLADFINGMLPEDMRKGTLEATATPGFRPGADTSRPTPPDANAVPAATAPALALVADPSTPQSGATAYTGPELTSFNQPGDPAEMPPATPEVGVQHASTPRTDTFGA